MYDAKNSGTVVPENLNSANIFHIASILGTNVPNQADKIKKSLPPEVTSNLTDAQKAITENTLITQIKNSESETYTWGVSQLGMKAMIDSPSVKDTIDTLTLQGIGNPGPALTFTLNDKSKPKSIHISISGHGNTDQKLFLLKNIALSSNQSISTMMCNGGKEIIISNNGPDTTFDLQLYLNKKTSENKMGIKLESNAVAHIIPSDWSESNLANSPIQMNVYDQILGGTILRQVSI